MDELAFLSLFKLLFILLNKIYRLFYKLCFWLGWVFVFIFRLFILTVKKVINIIRIYECIRILRIKLMPTSPEVNFEEVKEKAKAIVEKVKEEIVLLKKNQ